MLNQNNLIRNVIYTFAWLAMLMAFPFSIAQAYNLPAKLIITVSFLLLSFLAFLFIEKIKVSKSLSIIFLVQLFSIVVFYFLHSDAAYINLFLNVAFALVIYINFNNYIDQQLFIRGFVYFVLVMSVFSVITFILCIAFNFSPVSEFKNPDGRTAYNFIICFTNSLFDIGSAKIIRPAGYFDEPGTLSFYIVVAILLNDLTFSQKKVRILLFFCGVFTLSVAFYGVTFVYLLLRFKFRYVSKLIIFSLAAIIIGVVIYSQLSEDKKVILYGYTFQRVESFFSASSNNNSNTTSYFNGDNRSDLINLSKEAIKQSPIIGVGISYAAKPGTIFFGKFMGANLLGMFGVHGILGGLILSLHVLYYGWISIKTGRFGLEIKSFIIYFLLILQRPDYIGGILPYVVVIILICVTKLYHKKFINEQNFNYNSSLQ